MPRQSAVEVENNFKNGFITEATALNFPEHACTETYNCVFNFDGSVDRRLGFDFENNSTVKTIDRSNKVVVSYLWRNVSGNGDVTLLAVQIGATIYFYKIISGQVSAGALTSTVTLTPVTDAPVPDTVEAQFSDGNGYLFVTHPYCEPMRIAYNSTLNEVSATNIILTIRDLEGCVTDPYAIDQRPTGAISGIDTGHLYNLYNQGWTTTNLNAWDTARTDMPSNADVMFAFKNTDDAFDVTTVPNAIAGNSRAPNGHFILNLYNQDRNTAAGVTGVGATITGPNRPSTSAFFAGRLFYAGINVAKFNSNIYFSQIIERDPQYGFCYQVNDPSSEDLFDLLPSDGGVIKIPEAGTIYRLTAVPGGLIVNAANGVWFVTGSTGIGFTATDYTEQKISSVNTLSATSFVDILGFPAWWNNDGIYIVAAQSGNSLPIVQCLTDASIKSFYQALPLSSKRLAKGFYNKVTKRVQWLFRSTDTDQITNLYEYDRILNLDTRTGAFYLWSASDSSIKINSIVVTDSSSGAISINNVVDNSSNRVIDASGNHIIMFQTAGATSTPSSKYLISYPNGSSYFITFADESNVQYMDWFQLDLTGVDYLSYLITGYKIRGEGIRKFQSNWVRVFSDLTNDIAYYFQGVWDYSKTGSGTGKWSTKQYVSKAAGNFNTAMRRLKVRGSGTTLQFRVSSVTGKPFSLLGWSALQTGNSTP